MAKKTEDFPVRECVKDCILTLAECSKRLHGAQIKLSKTADGIGMGMTSHMIVCCLTTGLALVTAACESLLARVSAIIITQSEESESGN